MQFTAVVGSSDISMQMHVAFSFQPFARKIALALKIPLPSHAEIVRCGKTFGWIAVTLGYEEETLCITRTRQNRLDYFFKGVFLSLCRGYSASWV